MQLAEVHLGGMLGFFVTLLIFFGVDFHLTRKRSTDSGRGTVLWALISAVGEVATAIALLLTWVAMFLPPETEAVDVWFVFGAGTIAAICAVTLTFETVVRRIAAARANFDEGELPPP